MTIRKNLFIFASICAIATSALLLLASSSTSNFISAQQKVEKLVELTDETIDQAIRENPLVFIMFYAPWCGHSKKMAPEFARMANDGDYPNVLFGRIDMSVNVASAKKYDVKHFPTLRFFRHGASFGEYDGSREIAAIKAYVHHASRHGVKVFPSKDVFNGFLNNAEFPTAICCDAAESANCKPFDAASDKARNENIRWFAFPDAEKVDEYGLGKFKGKVIVIKSVMEEEPGASLTDESRFQEVKASGPNANPDELIREIHMLSVGTFGSLNPETYREYMHIKLPMFYLFLSSGKKELNEANKKAYDAVRAVAPSYKGKLIFVHIDASKYGSLAPRVGLAGDHFPAIAIDNAGSFYNIGQDPAVAIDQARARRLADDYLAGKLARFIRSEPSSAKPTVDGLTTVVASNFDQLVLKSENDVFIQFHAPWCSHCKEMGPALADLGKKMKEEDVTVARFDATANEYDKEKFQVAGFPTIFYVKKNQAQQQQQDDSNKGPYTIEEYSGGRTLEEMLAYVRKKADQ